MKTRLMEWIKLNLLYPVWHFQRCRVCRKCYYVPAVAGEFPILFCSDKCANDPQRHQYPSVSCHNRVAMFFNGAAVGLLIWAIFKYVLF